MGGQGNRFCPLPDNNKIETVEAKLVATGIMFLRYGPDKK